MTVYIRRYCLTHYASMYSDRKVSIILGLVSSDSDAATKLQSIPWSPLQLYCYLGRRGQLIL